LEYDIVVYYAVCDDICAGQHALSHSLNDTFWNPTSLK